jgi:hypothetical protein
MVKIGLILALVLITSGCVCDYYTTPQGGLRSKRLYRRYVKFDYELPKGIDTNCLYQHKFSIYKYMDGTIDTVYPKRSHWYSRYFANGRIVFFQVPFGLIDSTNGEPFRLERGRIGYYKHKKGKFYAFGYSTVDCGSFGKGELNRIEGNVLIFGKGNERTYDEKIDAPAAWLPPGKPDW